MPSLLAPGRRCHYPLINAAQLLQKQKRTVANDRFRNFALSPQGANLYISILPADSVLGPTPNYIERTLEPCIREANRLILEGATPSQIDHALSGIGLTMGLLAVLDVIGLDSGFAACRDAIALDPSYRRITDELIALGHLGQKSGRGFYFYQGCERNEDYEVVAIAERVADELQIRRRPIGELEIQERCLLMLINESIRLVDEGVARSADEFDQIWLKYIGFPVNPVGPLARAQALGLSKVLDTLLRYRNDLGEYGRMWFHPALLLERLVACGVAHVEQI
jgi:3-hydroxyacyl-CoA dehydrogenase